MKVWNPPWQGDYKAGHQLSRSSIDGKLTPLVFGASPVDIHHHVRISLTSQISQSRRN
jgi:hypothetical protein